MLVPLLISHTQYQNRYTNLRLFSQIASPQFSPVFRPLNPRQLIDNIALEFADLIQERQLLFKNCLPRDLYLAGDSAKLYQALSNLILNALVYNQEQGIVEVYGRQRHGRIHLTILDTGIGMSQKESTLARRGFFRAQKARELYPEGQGLGLAMARRIIQKHRGRLRIKSQKGQGTAVVIELENSLCPTPLFKNGEQQ